MLLKAEGLSVNYGTIEALRDVSFHVGEQEFVALLGPNGAGKSSALKAVTGLLPLVGGQITAGTVRFRGLPIAGLRTDELVKHRICLVPEGRHVFRSLSVLENLEMGGYTVASRDLVRDRIAESLKLFPQLQARAKTKAGALSSGEQQMLAIARALVADPELLIADEPSLGLSPVAVDTVFEKLREINGSGTAILIVEQKVDVALAYCGRAYVFNLGCVVKEGDRQALLDDASLKPLFLGG
ncbi:MAG: ABC transporter ATP-binding protein [Acidobacteriota bacterium]